MLQTNRQNDYSEFDFEFFKNNYNNSDGSSKDSTPRKRFWERSLPFLLPAFIYKWIYQTDLSAND